MMDYYIKQCVLWQKLHFR